MLAPASEVRESRKARIALPRVCHPRGWTRWLSCAGKAVRSGQDAFSDTDSTKADYKACARPGPACRTGGRMVMADYVALVGVDWGDKKHAYEVRAMEGGAVRRGSFEQSAGAVHAWVAELRAQYPCGTIGVALEQSRGALVYALSRYEFIELLPLHPAQTAAYRAVVRPSGAKSDPLDAGLICDFVEKHGETVRPWRASDPLTRELLILVEWRRKLVDGRNSSCNQLRDVLKQYFPQVLDWVGELDSAMALAFLERWPTLEQLQRSRPLTVRRFFTSHGSRSAERIEQRLSSIASAAALHSDRALIDALSTVAGTLVALIRTASESIQQLDERIEQLWHTYPDRHIFESFPGAGAVLAPRLAVALGTDPERWTASSLQSFSGIAPLTVASGSSCWIHSRWKCPKFLRQTFHEFAASSIPWSKWAAAFYREQRRRGKGHHAAVRALAFRWIRVIVRCWKDRLPYDEDRYTQRLIDTRSPLAAALTP
jgi:transposase